jgi:hypothetical protein
MSNLKNLQLVTKEAEVEFPGLPGFFVKLGAVSREVSRRLKEESEVTKIDAKYKVPVKELDEAIFAAKFSKAAIKGWRGLKYKYLDELMLVDLSGVEDLEACMDYTEEDAIDLLKASVVFDNWLNDQVFSLQSFRSSAKS